MMREGKGFAVEGGEELLSRVVRERSGNEQVGGLWESSFATNCCGNLLRMTRE